MLRLLKRSGTPLGVNAIARELELVPSTCLHILRILVREDFVRFDFDTKRYSLSTGLLELADAALVADGFAAAVQPELQRLSGRYAVTAVGVEVVGLDQMFAVAMARSTSLVSLQVGVGSRFPSLISATGRCVAAFGGFPWAELQRRFRALPWDNAPSLREWRREIDEVRRAGYSIDRGRYIGGIGIVAVPVLGGGPLTHAIAAIGLAEQLDSATAIRLAEDMQESARALAGQYRLFA
jgi:DNA-binding IclR family transcriptional regulator